MEPGDIQFNCNFARLPLITQEVYNVICTRDQAIREQLPREFLEYYVTALLWARLLHIKRGYGFTSMTGEEDDYFNKFSGKILSLPEPIYNFLTMIGTIRDLRHGGIRRTLYLSDHKLPIALAGGRGGYHTNQVKKYSLSHNLFEEVPCLGVSGDCIRFLASAGNPIVQTFPFLPLDMEAIPLNMVGYFGPPGPITAGVSSVLTLLSISAYGFEEDIAGTRLNMGIIDYVLDIIQKSRAFRVTNFRIDRMPLDGSQTQVIPTVPVDQTVLIHHGLDPTITTWTQRFVEARQMPCFNGECVKESYYAGFQLYKEGHGEDHSNWSCTRARDPVNTWTIGSRCTVKRNIRRGPVKDLFGFGGGRGRLWSQSVMTQEYCEKYLMFSNS